MASNELKEIRKAMTKEAIREHQMAKTGGTQTDLFTCGKCKKKNCTYTQVSLPAPAASIALTSARDKICHSPELLLLLDRPCSLAEILLLIERSFLRAWGPLKYSADAFAYIFRWSLCNFLWSFVQMLLCIWKSRDLCSTKEGFKSMSCCLLSSLGELHVESRCWECEGSEKEGVGSVEERDCRN